MYDVASPHPDPILHAKLKDTSDLLNVNVQQLTEHFEGSRFSYSTQALPVNVLLDTLNRPYGETGEYEKKTCIKWIKDPSRIVSHIVAGNTKDTGGQWADNPIKASWDIGALSYAGMLSLPGYSFDQYYQDFHGTPAPFYLRPTRRDIAGYFAEYPRQVGIADAIHSQEFLSGISRCGQGFWIGSHQLFCKHLVLASGIFTNLLSPRPLLQPLTQLKPLPHSDGPVLVVGSGFTAADVILSTPRDCNIIHVYKWAPRTAPSPLRACHQQAYPEYAGVYRKMKTAALAYQNATSHRPSTQRRPSTIDSSRDWNATYEGLPNTAIVDVQAIDDHALVTFQAGDHPPFTRLVRGFAYVVGRRGSLEYLNPQLRAEVCSDPDSWRATSGSSLRDKVSEDLEIAPNVFVIGSLTGDSLIRFSYGGCTYAAGRLSPKHTASDAYTVASASSDAMAVTEQPPHVYQRYSPVPLMHGLQGHATVFLPEQHLSLDRRKSAICVDAAS